MTGRMPQCGASWGEEEKNMISIAIDGKPIKKYYVRVRTYKKVGKTNYYSSWSKEIGRAHV